jgi:hypothetical protein
MELRTITISTNHDNKQRNIPEELKAVHRQLIRSTSGQFLFATKAKA